MRKQTITGHETSHQSTVPLKKCARENGGIVREIKGYYYTVDTPIELMLNAYISITSRQLLFLCVGVMRGKRQTASLFLEHA